MAIEIPQARNRKRLEAADALAQDVALEAACVGKVGFDTSRGAQHVARKMRLKKRESLKAYKCPHCGRWHVGHRSK